MKNAATVTSLSLKNLSNNLKLTKNIKEKEI